MVDCVVLKRSFSAIQPHGDFEWFQLGFICYSYAWPRVPLSALKTWSSAGHYVLLTVGTSCSVLYW